MKYIEKILKGFVFVFVFSIVLLGNASGVRAGSYMRFDNKIKIIDTNSVEFQKSIEDAFKEKYGENYKEIILENFKSAEMSDSFDLKYYNKMTNTITYPIDFGGKYINDNNKLVFQIVKNLNLKSETQKVIDSISDDYIIEYVDNSYNELENVNNKIINYFQLHEVNDSNVVANYIDVKNNIVIVELKDNSIKEQELFKENIIDSKVIKFVKNNTTETLTTTYNAGGNFGGFCSIGYRAKMNGYDGFVTAGHCVYEGQKISGYGETIKSVESGSIDAAFVKLYSGNSVTNNIQWGYYPSTAVNSTTPGYPNLYTVGRIIAKSGMKTQATVGTIQNVNYTSNTGGHQLTNIVKTSAQCNNGDSGGLVYVPGTTASHNGTVIGVVRSKIYSGTDDTVPGDMTFTKSSLIDSQFNLTRY